MRKKKSSDHEHYLLITGQNLSFWDTWVIAMGPVRTQVSRIAMQHECHLKSKWMLFYPGDVNSLCLELLHHSLKGLAIWLTHATEIISQHVTILYSEVWRTIIPEKQNLIPFPKVNWPPTIDVRQLHLVSGWSMFRLFWVLIHSLLH